MLALATRLSSSRKLHGPEARCRRASSRKWSSLPTCTSIAACSRAAWLPCEGHNSSVHSFTSRQSVAALAPQQREHFGRQPRRRPVQLNAGSRSVEKAEAVLAGSATELPISAVLAEIVQSLEAAPNLVLQVLAAVRRCSNPALNQASACLRPGCMPPGIPGGISMSLTSTVVSYYFLMNASAHPSTWNSAGPSRRR